MTQSTVPPPNLLDHVVDVALGREKPSIEEIERRGMRRGVFDGLLALVQWTPSGGKSITTLVRCKNISPDGICLHSSYMLHPDREGVLLVKRSSGEHVLLGVRVVYCRYVDNMLHESGVVIIPACRTFTLDDFRDAAGDLPSLDASNPS